MSENSGLEKTGYQLEAKSNVWQRPEYSSIAYSDGDEVEQRIGRIIDEADDLSVLSTELSKKYTDWPSLYHLSSSRANILRPMASILQGADVLEIGSGCGAITRYLGEIGANVIAVEGSLRRAAITRSRTRDLCNVNVVAERFNEFSCEKKFDIVTLIGVLEYANLFTPGENPAQIMLERVRSFLKPGGRVIIAIENQLGLKYFASAPEDHLGEAMYGIEGRYRKDQPQTYGRRVLENILKKSGFSHSNFMAAFPDYKFPVSIVTEAGVHDPDFDASAFAWQSARRDNQLPPVLSFSPELAWPGIFDNGLALDFANSFLVIASPLDISHLNKEVLAHHFSTDRRPEYCKETVFVRNDDEEIKVVCRLLSDAEINSKDSLINFRPEMESSYSHGTSLSWELVKIISRDGWRFDDVVGYFKRYLEILLSLINSNSGSVVSWSAGCDFYVPGQFIDALPQNIICMPGGRHRLIDVEWQEVVEIPIARVLFRAIFWQVSSLSRIGRSEDITKSITRKDLTLVIFSRLGFSEDTEDFYNFLKLESIFQEVATGRSNNNLMKYWSESILPLVNLNQAVVQKDAQLAQLDQVISEMDTQISEIASHVSKNDCQLSQRYEQVVAIKNALIERDAEIAALYNSTSWRMTAPVRWISRQVKRSRRVVKLLPTLIQRGDGINNTVKKAVRIYRREGFAGIKRAIRGGLL